MAPARVDEVIEQVDLTKFAKRIVGTLSGGCCAKLESGMPVMLTAGTRSAQRPNDITTKGPVSTATMLVPGTG